MQTKIFPLIRPDELLTSYKKNNIILIDAGSGNDAKDKYLQSHLDGALYVDLNTQLADIKADAASGGRHPLPTVAQFAAILGQLGISPDSHVVVYDDKNASNAAARFWWMLQSIGHKKVQVLDGGFQAAVKAGFPVNAATVVPEPTTVYNNAGWILPMASMQEVEKAAKDDQYLVIDVRSEERYKGITEPIDIIAGHIPGAVNIPFTTNLDAEGFFLPADKLREKYENAFGNTEQENIIVHCGSGVTACHTLLAIAAAGFQIPGLYVGSWSEWSNNKMPVAKDS
ncbi:sulfurtransferase [Ferruginibacter sp. SUN106]|uniref:sulfurtransferase n=1 Tax=Ferruginibacter sp. SUN106 TaxID=2978348 RepID=UPI003D3630EA